MNSEKVKEIKEKLQEEIFIANSFGDKLRKVPTIELENLLTLINELESENEILRNAKVVYETVDYCYEDLKKAEKRIAELENGIAKSMLGCEFLPDCTNEKLKQFAERLKEKFAPYSYVIVKLDSIYDKIDETLKEFIK